MNEFSLYLGTLVEKFMNFGSYIFGLSANFFYQKFIKKFTSIPEKSNIKENITSKYIELTILNLKIDKNIPNYVNFIFVPKCIIYLFLFKKKPLVLYKFFNIKIYINSNVLNNPTKIIPQHFNNSILNNIHSMINQGYGLVNNITSIFLNNQKIIFENSKIVFNDFEILLKKHYIHIYNNKITSLCKSITINYNEIELIKIKSMKNIIGNKIECYISNILVKITEKLDFENLIDFIKNIEFESSNNTLQFFIAIENVNVKIINKNYMLLSINDIQSDLTKFICSNVIKIKCFKKNILRIDKPIYYFNSNQLECDNFNMNIFKSTGHKILLSLNKYIKKQKIDIIKPIIKKFNLDIKKDYINTLKSNFQTIIPKTNKIDYFPNNLEKSFMVKSNNITNSTFVKRNNNNIKFKIFIRKSEILVTNNQISKALFINENIILNLISKNNFIITNTNLIIKYNDADVLKKVSSNKKVYINMNYNSGKLIVRIGYTYFNIMTEFFKMISDVVHKNTTSLMKLMYYNYDKNTVINNFSIKYFKLDPIMMNVFYYPKTCNYYNLFQGNFGEMYRIVNYKDVKLNTKCVIIHYPYNISMIFKKIIKIWLDDISANQKENILAGTNLDKMVKNPKNYLRSFFSSVEKLVSISSDLVNK